jgi:hypothetical protein
MLRKFKNLIFFDKKLFLYRYLFRYNFKIEIKKELRDEKNISYFIFIEWIVVCEFS